MRSDCLEIMFYQWIKITYCLFACSANASRVYSREWRHVKCVQLLNYASPPKIKHAIFHALWDSWKGGCGKSIDHSRRSTLLRDYNKNIAWTRQPNPTVIDDNLHCYLKDLFEGDIVLDDNTLRAITGGISYRGALSSTDESRWPDNTVPYILSCLCE